MENLNENFGFNKKLREKLKRIYFIYFADEEAK
jgi:hypothetical protein